jgi:enoyl-CoA hydratase
MEILSERNGAITTLTLNRPERLNAVSLTLYQQLSDRLRELDRDAAVRAIVLTGSGRAFCVGADLKAHDGSPPTRDQKREYIRAAQRAHARLQRSAKPIVAAVNGHAIGAGLELALSSDFVIVSERAKLRFPEVRLGTFVGGGTVYTLPRRVGLQRAKSLLLLGDLFTPAEALEWGIANEVVAPDRVVPAAIELAECVVRGAPQSLAAAKRLLNYASHLEPRRAMALEAGALLRCMETRDWKEGLRAFHERREPEFTGE